MARMSAGLLMYRERDGVVEVLLAHPGGPYFARRDLGAWTIPKGEIEPGDEPLPTAIREFEEEIGTRPEGNFLPLGSIRQRGGKVVMAWAFAGDRADDEPVRSNTFQMEWPPRSGATREFPEVDMAAFFDLQTARRKINVAQVKLLDRLETLLDVDER
ncbi:MAG: NUDIX domain-containing protein [Planctomycetota bacterium]|jgi:predicted NUDIX family NTP pyrophosphohydrolase